jgi:hypothetical protein
VHAEELAHGLRALLAELVVVFLGARIVGVALDLQVHVLVVGFSFSVNSDRRCSASGERFAALTGNFTESSLSTRAYWNLPSASLPAAMARSRASLEVLSSSPIWVS